MSKKEIQMWDVTVTFRVRKDSHEAHTKKELKENVCNGIGKNEMNCIEAEEIEVKIE
ncbi:MAG: hypothetical protein ACTSWD_04850 [Candidatus Heimdallarchaeota archaeon]